jgi:hypothetical protein
VRLRAVDTIGSTRLPAGCHIFHQSDDDGQNGTSHASAGNLTEQSDDVQSASGASTGKRRNYGLKQLPSDATADRTGNRIAKSPEIDISERGACTIAANGTRNELDDKSDERFHVHLRFHVSPQEENDSGKIKDRRPPSGRGLGRTLKWVRTIPYRHTRYVAANS